MSAAELYDKITLKNVHKSPLTPIATTSLSISIGAAAAAYSWSQISVSFFDANGDEITNAGTPPSGTVAGTITGTVSGKYKEPGTQRYCDFAATLDLSLAQSFAAQLSAVSDFILTIAAIGGSPAAAHWQVTTTCFNS